MERAPLGSIEAYAFESCLAGRVPDHMAKTLDKLCDAGLIDEQAKPTPAGRALWAEYREFLLRQTVRGNVLWGMPTETLEALARIADGGPATLADETLLRRHQGLAQRVRGNGPLTITRAGLYAVKLARCDGLIR